MSAIKTKLLKSTIAVLILYTNYVKRAFECKEAEKFGRLWPNYTKIVWKNPKSKQMDNFSCGVYSIAYDTTFFLGYDPETYEFASPTWSWNHTILMREHILRMFEQGKLLPFPTSE